MYRNFVNGWVLLMDTSNTIRALGLLGFLLLGYGAPTLAAGQTLYGADLFSDELVSIDPATGAATIVGGFGAEGPNVSSLAANAAGELFGFDIRWDGQLYSQFLSINPATGVATAIGAPVDAEIRGLAFDPSSGSLFATNDSDNELVSVDTSSGALTVIGNTGAAGDVRGLSFAPDGTLYAVDFSDDELLTLDLGSGASTSVGALGFNVVLAIAFDANGNLYGADAATDQLISIDTSTGAGTAIGPLSGLSSGGTVQGLTFSPLQPVPLPGALPLMITALLGLGYRRKRCQPGL